MYIYRVQIKNFRNIVNLDWKPNKNINVLFGSNGSGKTNFAQALDLVFSCNNFDSFFDLSDFHNGDIAKKIEIEIWLKNVEEFDHKISLLIQHIDAQDNFICDDNSNGSEKILAIKLESDDSQRKIWTIQRSVGNEAINASIKNAIGYKFIGADRQPLKEITLKNNGLLYSLSENLIDEQLKQISDHLVSSSETLFSNSPEIKQYLEKIRSLMAFSFGDKFNMALKNPNSAFNYSGFELRTTENDLSLSFDRHSRGKQNMFLLSLLRTTLNNKAIIFIEEIEQNLEPINQRRMAKLLTSITEGQIFITSHSPSLIEYFNFENIFHFCPTKVNHIAHEDNIKKEISITGKKQYLSALLAKNILVVEGESEEASLPLFSDKLNGILFETDTEIFSLRGKDKIKIFANEFKSLGKTVCVLLDNDCDISRLITDIHLSVDKIFIAKNDYEDMIYNDCRNIIEVFETLVHFQSIKDKLKNIKSKREDEIRPKLLNVHNCLQTLDFNTLETYCDLYNHKVLFTYVLHDSFATPYFSRTITNSISEFGVPQQIQLLFENILNPVIRKFNTTIPNAFVLESNNA